MITRYIDVGGGSMMPAEKIKFLLDIQAASTKKILDRYEAKDIKPLVRQGQKRRSAIITSSDIPYLSQVSPETIAKRAEEMGIQLLNVGKGLYISLDKISAILPFDSFTAIRERQEDEFGRRSYSFVRKTKKRMSLILLETGESIGVANTPETLAKRINSLYGTVEGDSLKALAREVEKCAE